MLKFIKVISLCFSFLIYSQVAESSDIETMCKIAIKNGDSFLDITEKMFSTIDNILPITVSGISIGIDGEKTDMEGEPHPPVCVCEIPIPPFVRTGMAIGFWNPLGNIDTVSIPYCFPSLGMSLPVPLGASRAYGARSSGVRDQFITANTHYFSYLSVMKMVSESLFAGCLTIPTQTGIDHMSEIQVWWQNDLWAMTLSPESLLVANPIAQTSCMADSLSVSLSKKALNPLFWCAGAWGSIYPLTTNVGSGTALTSFAMLVARTLVEQTKFLKIQKVNGNHMLSKMCQPIPTQFLLKNEINIFPLYPQAKKSRFPIGYPSEIWGVGLDNPTNMGVMTWMLYQKRDCCYL